MACIKPHSQILRVTTQSEILIRQCYGHFVPDIYLLFVRTKDHMPLHKSTIISSEHIGLVYQTYDGTKYGLEGVGNDAGHVSSACMTADASGLSSGSH
jgi:hypothetical protein